MLLYQVQSTCTRLVMCTWYDKRQCVDSADPAGTFEHVLPVTCSLVERFLRRLVVVSCYAFSYQIVHIVTWYCTTTVAAHR